MPKATVEKQSAKVDCPVLDGTAREEFRAAAAAANTFSYATLAWLENKDSAPKVAWVRRAVGLSRELIHPWTIEILFLVGVVGLVRFTELQRALDVSSRTLADRLRQLKEAELLERIVHDEQPVRVEYLTTKKGRKMAALAGPLIAYLGMAALESERRRSGDQP